MYQSETSKRFLEEDLETNLNEENKISENVE
jgi:hypothetical protein